MKITPQHFPEGTRVVGTTGATRGAHGTVVGWHKSNIGIEWDAGGRHHAPAHHGGIAHVERCEICGGELYDGICRTNLERN